MPKRIRLIIITMCLVLLGFFIFKSQQEKLNKEKTAPSVKPIDTPTSFHKDNSPKKVSAQRKDLVKADQPKNLVEQLNETKVSANDRIYQVKDLDIKSNSRQANDNLKLLITFINSPNPLRDNSQIHEHNNFISHQFKREAALRVFSIKKIANELSMKKMRSSLTQIITENQDPSLVRIAEQVLAAKEKGEDYFENARQAVRSMKLPNRKTDRDDHDHHDND